MKKSTRASKMTGLMTVVTAERQVKVVKFLGNDLVSTYNVNFKENTLRNIKFNQDLRNPFFKDRVKFPFKGHKPPIGVS